MILRRVIGHLRKQEWTAIAIDFFIVVIGVFVGLQVSNWNEARANQGIVARHLAEISEDLDANLQIHPVLYASAVARIAAVDYIYEQAFNIELPKTLTLSTETWEAPATTPISEDRLDNIMGAIDLVRIRVGARAGYESLISSGHLGLLENRDLARQLQLYYGSYDDLIDTNVVSEHFATPGPLPEHGISVFDERPVEDIIQLARENEDFAAYLRTTREWAIVHAGLLEDLRIETEELRTAIDAERAKFQ